MKKLAHQALVFYVLFVICMLAFSWYNMLQPAEWRHSPSDEISFELMVFFSCLISLFSLLVMKDEGLIE